MKRERLEFEHWRRYLQILQDQVPEWEKEYRKGHKQALASVVQDCAARLSVTPMGSRHLDTSHRLTQLL